METLLRKYLWAVDGLVVALCMIFLARATSTAIEKKLVVSGPPAKAAVRAVVATAAPIYTKQVEEILKRNIFCSTCPPILPVAGTETGATAASAAAAHRAQPQAARDHVRAAARGSALVDGDHP